MAKAKASRKSKGKPRKKSSPGKPARKPALKKSPTKKSARPTKKTQPGLPELLRDAALKILDDRQAEDIAAVNLTGHSSLADYLIIASGRSARQVAAMADYLREAFIKSGAKNIRLEGLPEGNWVVVDSGDVIVHLFRPEVRRYYDLDRLFDT